LELRTAFKNKNSAKEADCLREAIANFKKILENDINI
jgi:hypothetical protein